VQKSKQKIITLKLNKQKKIDFEKVHMKVTVKAAKKISKFSL